MLLHSQREKIDLLEGTDFPFFYQAAKLRHGHPFFFFVSSGSSPAAATVPVQDNAIGIAYMYVAVIDMYVYNDELP